VKCDSLISDLTSRPGLRRSCRVKCDAQISDGSYRKQPREKAREGCQGDEPDSDGDENPPAPALHLTHVGPNYSDDALLGGCNGKRQQEHQQDHDQRGVCKRHQRRPESTRCECVPGQTGQNWTRSAEPRQQVPKAENGETGDRTLPAIAGLRLHERPGEVLDRVQGKRQGPNLDQAKDDQQQPDNGAEDPTGRINALISTVHLPPDWKVKRAVPGSKWSTMGNTAHEPFAGLPWWEAPPPWLRRLAARFVSPTPPLAD